LVAEVAEACPGHREEEGEEVEVEGVHRGNSLASEEEEGEEDQ
jgi:hypothetical protein